MVYVQSPPSSTNLDTRSRRGLVEISGALGAGKTELLLRLLAEGSPLRETRIAWIEEAATIYPCAFLQAGVALERVLFADCPEGASVLWAAHQAIRSQVFGAVVVKLKGASPRISETDLRRLQLSAERNQVTVFLVSEYPTREAWPISLQLEVSRSRPDSPAPGAPVAPVVKILRSRGGVAEWLPEVLSASLAS